MTTGNSKRCCHGDISSKSNMTAMAAVLRDTSGSSDEGGKKNSNASLMVTEVRQLVTAV